MALGLDIIMVGLTTSDHHDMEDRVKKILCPASTLLQIWFLHKCDAKGGIKTAHTDKTRAFSLPVPLPKAKVADCLASLAVDYVI